MNELIQGWVASGRAADIILAVVVLEWLALTAWRARGGSGLDPLRLTVMLIPGACLVVALRIALTGGPWQWIALALLASFAGHLADLVLRLKGLR